MRRSKPFHYILIILHKDDGGRAHQGLPVYPHMDSHLAESHAGLCPASMTETSHLRRPFMLICLALLDKVWIDGETRIIQKRYDKLCRGEVPRRHHGTLLTLDVDVSRMV